MRIRHVNSSYTSTLWCVGSGAVLLDLLGIGDRVEDGLLTALARPTDYLTGLSASPESGGHGARAAGCPSTTTALRRQVGQHPSQDSVLASPVRDYR
jgi:hypothetical protein